MKNNIKSKGPNRVIGIWLMIGVLMIFIQIIVGGITRLTGSGLSITEWDIVLGTIPPLTDSKWVEEFEKYRSTPQYEQINKGMSLSEFKFIYWWEYIHRFWARLMGLVFIIPFLFFVYKKWIDSKLMKQLLTVVVLAGIVASFGWVMVASGLQDKPWVSPYKLVMHLSLALVTFGYLLWISMPFWFKKIEQPMSGFYKKSKKLLIILLVAVSVQIVLGGLMSGMRAALFYPTFPLMHSSYIPPEILQAENWTISSFSHWYEGTFAVAAVQFFHRNLGYLITAFVIFIAVMVFRKSTDKRLSLGVSVLVFVTLTQVLLGIITLLLSVGNIPVSWGVIHQGVAVILLAVIFYLIYILSHVEEKSVKLN
ncbi:MAG: heme A synthase [Chitinophagaceae bacterium]|nr:MAG: heme A synthase [Chitinophagaceae bacterium]